MELLLWRWSVGVQWASLAMIAVFFLVLERSLRFAGLRAWVGAWFANLLALGITVLYWNWRPSGWPFRTISAGYMGAKAAFAVLLILGALQLVRQGPARRRLFLLGPVALFATAGFLLTSLEALGALANPSMSVLFAVGGILLLRERGMHWLAAAMLLRALVFLLTSLAFALISPAAGAAPELVALAHMFVSVHSFVDTGAEWLLALGCVLVLSDRVSNELRQSHRELLSVQEDLRRIMGNHPTAPARDDGA